jgi:hypothetical protein
MLKCRGLPAIKTAGVAAGGTGCERAAETAGGPRQQQSFANPDRALLQKSPIQLALPLLNYHSWSSRSQRSMLARMTLPMSQSLRRTIRLHPAA